MAVRMLYVKVKQEYKNSKTMSSGFLINDYF